MEDEKVQTESHISQLHSQKAHTEEATKRLQEIDTSYLITMKQLETGRTQAEHALDVMRDEQIHLKEVQQLGEAIKEQAVKDKEQTEEAQR